MFREMRRKNQALSSEECIQVLNRATSGVLAVSGDDGYPYAVPLSYVYHNNKIYFHGAKTGHKLDGIERNEKVSFCVIDQDQIVQEEYTSYFRSVIVFGRARVMGDEDKRRALEILTARYSPDIKETDRSQKIDEGLKNVSMIELEIEYMSGKEANKLAKAKK